MMKEVKKIPVAILEEKLSETKQNTKERKYQEK